MQYRAQNKWVNPENLKSLSYFVQLLEELLFDYTHSTYKPSIMHVPSLCFEALMTIDDIENGCINQAHITHIIDELIESLKKDKIAISLLTLPLNTFIEQLKSTSHGINDKKTVLELLNLQLEKNKYENKLKEELISCIYSEYNPDNIRELTRLLVTHLTLRGVSKEYLTEIMIEHFYEKKIESNDEIKQFLKKIPNDKIEFVVYFKVDKSFLNIKKSIKNLDIEVLERIPEELKNDIFFNVNKERIIVSVKDESFDYYSARKSAEETLKLAATLLSIYHHKQEPSWELENHISYGDGNHKVISVTINPMHLCRDLKIKAAGKKFDEFVEGFSMSSGSFKKFIRCVQLHSMALRTNSVENQILNLWVAIESLVPDELKKENDNTIDHIINTIIPFLNIVYMEGLVRSLSHDLNRWNESKFTKLIKPFNENNNMAKSLLMALTSSEKEEFIKQFKEELNNYPLLEQRFLHIEKLVLNPLNILDAIKRHDKRLTWQIKRIYRARNKIIHTGTTPMAAHRLVENMHEYLDMVLDTIIKMATMPAKISSVSQGFKTIDMKYKHYFNKIEKATKEQKKSENGQIEQTINIIELIFSE